MRLRYTTLLFDLDGTLLDFERNERRSLTTVLKEAGVQEMETAIACYRKVNHQLWADFERGLVSKQTIENTRFGRVFDQLGIKADDQSAVRRYRGLLMEGTDLIEGAQTLLEQLQGQAELDVVTNGDGPTQRKRLAKTGLDRFFRHVFISDDLGVQKPQREFFEIVLKTIEEKDPRKILVIGDSLSSDIQGGINAGLDTCWYHPEGTAAPKGPQPTWQIRRLQELPERLR